MQKHDWNPQLYLKFDKERIQPSIDLVSRINCENPEKIIDLGCGPGNSTQILFQRWPNSNIVGVDNSPAMIKKAKEDFPKQEWLLADAGKDKIDGKFDIVFSNATIQWVPNHDGLIEKFARLLNNKGILAVQLPLYLDMPVAKSISAIAGQGKWAEKTKGVKELFTIHSESFYYGHLVKHFNKIDIWTTDYFHIMESHATIVDMVRTTGLKPYLERIVDDNEKQEFEALILKEIVNDYPVQANGKVLFPFRRLFFVAGK